MKQKQRKEKEAMEAANEQALQAPIPAANMTPMPDIQGNVPAPMPVTSTDPPLSEAMEAAAVVGVAEVQPVVGPDGTAPIITETPVPPMEIDKVVTTSVPSTTAINGVLPTGEVLTTGNILITESLPTSEAAAPVETVVPDQTAPVANPTLLSPAPDSAETPPNDPEATQMDMNEVHV